MYSRQKRLRAQQVVQAAQQEQQVLQPAVRPERRALLPAGRQQVQELLQAALPQAGQQRLVQLRLQV